MILITGASGLLGTSLVTLAREQGRKVAGLYRRHPVQIPGADLLPADLTDPATTYRLFEELKPAAVIHCAAATNVDWCEQQPEATYAINVTASRIIAEIAARANARMLYISTDSVFDGERGHYAETDSPAPLNIYAQTKLHGEQTVLAGNPLAAVARINLYGWNTQPKQSLAEWILGQLVLGNVVPGLTDTIFCPILANDLAQVLLAMVDQELAGLYHVVGSEPVSKYEFARRLAAAFGFDPAKVLPVRMIEVGLKAPRPRNTSLNTEKISNALGISMPDVDSGIKRFAQLHADGYVDQLRNRLKVVRP